MKLLIHVEEPPPLVEVSVEDAINTPFTCMFCHSVFSPSKEDIEPVARLEWYACTCPGCGRRTGLTKEMKKQGLAKLAQHVGAEPQNQSPGSGDSEAKTTN